MAADTKYREDAERGLQDYCDTSLHTDSEIAKYCKNKNIPIENLDE